MSTTDRQRLTLQDLWSEACRLAGHLLTIFGEPDMIAAAGLSRRAALHCRNWLWSIEALVRRVIIAAALAFDPGKLAPLRQRRSGCTPKAKRAPAPAFRIFAFVTPARAPRDAASPAEPRPYTHVPFPSDDLLRLALRPPCPNDVEDQPRLSSNPRPRTPNPLHRGRISRFDPDYRGQDHSEVPRDPRPSSPRLRLQHVANPSRLPSPRWRRVEDEWERVLPAPGLASSISALLRVIEQPMARITRLARRLHASNLAARFSVLSPPTLKRPKRDRTPPLQLDDLIADAQAHIQPDTS